nr:acyl carrier protein [Clostridia bacterium]
MVLEKVTQKINENLGEEKEITMETSFADLGVDSLSFMEILMQLEDDLGVEIDLDGKKFETVGAFVEFVEGLIANK